MMVSKKKLHSRPISITERLRRGPNSSLVSLNSGKQSHHTCLGVQRCVMDVTGAYEGAEWNALKTKG